MDALYGIPPSSVANEPNIEVFPEENFSEVD